MKKDLQERWKTEAFWASVESGLEVLFQERKYEGPLDLRGIEVGMGPRKELHEVNFVDCKLSQVDFSYGEFSVAFNRASLQEVSFASAAFDRCMFFKARLRGCRFDKAVVVGRFDDAVLEACNFAGARLRSPSLTSASEYGGRRVTFLRCTFEGTLLQGVELRASRFVECQFQGAEFKRCDLRGVRFERCTFSDTRVLQSRIQGARFDPKPPDLVECEGEMAGQS